MIARMDALFSRSLLGRAFGPRVRLVFLFVMTWLGAALLLAFLLNEGRRESGEDYALRTSKARSAEARRSL